MNRTLIFTLLIAGAQCAWTDEATKHMPQFSRILLTDSFEVDIQQGRSHEVHITADSDNIDRLNAEVTDGELRLWLEEEDSWFSWWQKQGEVHVRVTTADLENLKMHGSGNVTAGPLALSHLAIELSGSGDLAIAELSAERLEVRLHGSGDVEIDELNAENTIVVVRGSGDTRLSGATTALEATVQGSGDISAGALKATHASIVIQGSGDVDTLAEATLNGTIQGSGNISYQGDAEVVSSLQGSGDMIEM